MKMNRVDRRTGFALLLAGLLSVSPTVASAQEPIVPPDGLVPDSLRLVDRIVAIVGDTAVLGSELEQEIFRVQEQVQNLPERGTAEWNAFVRQLLDQIVDRMILLQHAKRDPDLAMREDRLSEMVEQRFQQVRSNFPSDEAMQQAVEESGMNMFQYRQMLRADARAELLLQAYRQSLAQSGELPQVTVTQREVQEYFEENTPTEQRPATVSFDRILVDPQPAAEADSAARERAREALGELRSGTEFEVVARRYSEDPGTRAEGGDLGWLRRSDVDPAFADAAWVAPSGRAIGPVRTRFGYHVIKVENVRGGERKLRHILVRPEITEADVERARERAAALADSIRGGAEPGRLAERHRLPEASQVRFDEMPLQQVASQLGSEYRRELGAPVPGDVVGPFRTQGAAGQPTFVVLRIREYRPAGAYRREDFEDRIRQALMEQKQFDRYLERLRNETYVRILL